MLITLNGRLKEMSEENKDLHGCFGVVGAFFIIVGIAVIIAIGAGLYKFVMWCLA